MLSCLCRVLLNIPVVLYFVLRTVAICCLDVCDLLVVSRAQNLDQSLFVSSKTLEK